MAGQRTPRAAKRHLVRWTDDMDKKLLLAIQSECNAQGVNLPWNDIAALVGPTISGSAVIQHLAKLRIRMIQQNLSVPPPLRRGGGQRISTGFSIPRSRNTTNNTASDGKDPPKSRQNRRKRLDTENIDSDVTDSDAEYGKPRAKRAKPKSKVKPHTPSEEETISSARKGVKREESYSSNDNLSDEDQSENNESDGDEVVAAGAQFLNLVDDVQIMGDIAPEPSKSLIVRLPAKKASKPEGPTIGTDDRDNLAAGASGLPGYTGTSSVGSYAGIDPSLQNLQHVSQADHARDTSRYLSAGYGNIDGLPEPNFYDGTISLPHISYPDTFEHFNTTIPEGQGVVEDSWGPANSDYQPRRAIGSCASTTPHSLHAHGMPAMTRHPRSSLSHLSTTFTVDPAVQEDTVGGEYYSSGMSGMDRTPSSNLTEDSTNFPWLTRGGSSSGHTTGMDLDNVDTVQDSDLADLNLHQQYDGYGDGDVYF